MSNFDEILEMHEDDESESRDYKPIWKIKPNDKEAIHSWLKAEFKHLLGLNKARHSGMFENLLIYQGIQFSPNDQKTLNDFLDTSRVSSNSRRQKLIVNHLHDITETIVARTMRSSPQPDVTPANSNEIHDRNAAETVGQILNYLAYINKLPELEIKNKRLSLIGGESYIDVCWNKDLGDVHPLWLEAREEGFIDPLTGEPILDEHGKKLDAKKPMMTGEVELRPFEPWRVLLDEKDHYKDKNYSFTIEIADVDELKEDYPKSKDKLKRMESQRIFDTHAMTFRKLRNETFKIKFYHKKTKYMPDGFEAVFTLEALLESGASKYDHKNLTLVRLTDLDVPHSSHGMSFYELTKAIQWRHNQLSSDIITNQRLCAKPKWIVPKGRVKLEQLGNDITIVQYSGQVPPRLETFNPTPQEVFLFRDKLKEEMEQISTVTGVSRRDIPSQIHASVSMRLLSEMEAERSSVSTTKRNEFIKEIYILMMSVAGSFYKADDGRTMRILGNDEKYYIEDIEFSNLHKAYDVLIRNVDSVVESRATKEARIFDIISAKEGILNDEQIIDALDLGSIKKVSTVLTEALRAAESENEKIFKGREVLEPAPYEDSLVHWRTHVQKLQSHSIKNNASPEDIEALEQHIWLTEFMMIEKAKENPTFSAELAKLKLFPVYYRDGMGFSPSSKAHQEAVVQGQANKGEGISEKIGGEVDDGVINNDIQGE